MSSRIELTLCPSPAVGLLATLPWLSLLAFLVTAAIAENVWLAVAAPVALAGAIGQYRCQGLLRDRGAVTGLWVEQDQLYAQIAGRGRVPVTPGASSRLWYRLALLKLRPAGTTYQSYTTILLAPTTGQPGNVDADDFRRLRVWLRLGHRLPTSV